MGAILLIEDEPNVLELIKKILPGKSLKIIREIGKEEWEEARERGEGPKPSASAVGEVIREYLREAVNTGPEGAIHEYIMDKVEKDLIGIVLEKEKGNQVRVARRLGINRNTLRKKMKALKIIAQVVAR